MTIVSSILCGLLFVSQGDPVFSTLPFHQWMAQGNHVDIPWKVNLEAPELDDHQRLLSRVNIFVDGKRLSAFPPGGELVMLAEFEDSHGVTYQEHAVVKLDAMDKSLRHEVIVSSLGAYVIPGDYHVTVALMHRPSGAHDLERLSFHVAPLKHDPLPDLWRGAPPVEVIGRAMPEVDGHLHLPMALQHPVRVEVLVSLPKLDRADPAYFYCMNALFGQTEVLAQMRGDKVAVNVTLLDVQHRRAFPLTVRQGKLDRVQLYSALDQSNPGLMDVSDLRGPGGESEFLAREVQRRLQPASNGDGTRPVLIVLSLPGRLSRDKSVAPVSFDASAKGSVYYVRYFVPMTRFRAAEARVAHGEDGAFSSDPFPTDGYGQASNGSTDSPIQLALPGPAFEGVEVSDLLKPLKSRNWNLRYPSEFRKVLASIVDDISRM